ncbi:hypothetical protein C9374_001372 [Naegleria lovaniensis]|uniref:Uncharacterized protein n=1 Tax=Naegleria lovaniensis TaxID=51637 RepID=A0AA88GY35_NAELO|nr:uncharacterized protein C9374_001372 [Naegleria lovaniensis]KAG2387778.1 hypothetical protein C9374_001372 [Naegleria lovaniensis]
MQRSTSSSNNKALEDHPHLMDAPVLSASPIRSSKNTPLSSNNLGGVNLQMNSSRNTFVTPSSILRDVSSLNINTSLTIELNQHDLVFKQMERQRSELYQRMQDRIQRAKQLGHICKDQIGYLKTKIMDLEEKINEANNEHFNKHILQIDPKTALSTLSEVLSDETDSVEEDAREDTESLQLANQLLLDQVHQSHSHASKGSNVLSVSAQFKDNDDKEYEASVSSPFAKRSPNNLMSMYHMESPIRISPLRSGENNM